MLERITAFLGITDLIENDFLSGLVVILGIANVVFLLGILVMFFVRFLRKPGDGL
jgi:hypothetical protein